MQIDVLKDFRHFLTTSWPSLPDWMLDPINGKEALKDWLQINWETLVEYPLGVTLLPYADCSDGYVTMTRIFDPEVPPSHVFMLNQEYAFYGFMSFLHGEYQMHPPFDIVCGRSRAGELIFCKYQEAGLELMPIDGFLPTR